MASPILYDVIFRGQIAQGTTPAQVKQNLASMFQLSEQQIEAAFSGQPLMVKAHVPYQTAMQYKRAFEKAGTVCQLIQVEPSPPHTRSAAQTPDKRAPKKSSPASSSSSGNKKPPVNPAAARQDRLKRSRQPSPPRQKTSDTPSTRRTRPATEAQEPEPKKSRKYLKYAIGIYLLLAVVSFPFVMKLEKRRAEKMAAWGLAFVEQFNPNDWNMLSTDLSPIPEAYKGNVYLISLEPGDGGHNFHDAARSPDDIDVILWKISSQRIRTTGRLMGTQEQAIIRVLWPKHNEYAEYQILSRTPDMQMVLHPDGKMEGTFRTHVSTYELAKLFESGAPATSFRHKRLK
ncbi:hypothetical protein GF339_08620 [candidate division KSB3 bacterium]|uniref:Uncharacterized protein n=1 Tax=candidate division KSB3 bacterium TaxID=2044937 RepID=A0A9D5JUZ7_9BACT|nr:hypothetical protein [candidate division KSB3 bacterium]MBD3324633.1 hypothetical protein [candidate division KSB3 bacterium]